MISNKKISVSADLFGIPFCYLIKVRLKSRIEFPKDIWFSVLVLIEKVTIRINRLTNCAVTIIARRILDDDSNSDEDDLEL